MKKFLARLREPRWRHGRLNVLLLTVFLAVCVLVNAGVKSLEDEYGWAKDLSFNSYATTGEETAEVLSRLENDVEIYLLYQSGAVDSQLLALLSRYAVLSDRISILETDIARNPGILTRFEGDADHPLEADTVIVHCPATGRYQLLNYAHDFINYGYNMDSGAFEASGLSYEKNLTEAIAYTAQNRVPVVGLLQGHGELNEDALAVLISFLRSNHYDCRTVDLIRGDELDGVDLLLIAAPQKDLSDAEAEQIGLFSQNGGHLFVMRDYTDPLDGMPNYLALLASYGVRPLPGVAVADVSDTGGYYEEPLYLVPYMEPLDLTAQLIQNGMDLLLMPAASAFETPAEPTETLSTAVVLKTGPTGYLRSLTDGADTIEKQPGDIEGEIPVALYAHRMHANGNVSRLFATGSTATFTQEYLYQRAYSEEFLITVLGALVPEKTVALDIMASAALRPALAVGSKTIGIVLTLALPMLVAIAGLCVLLPRRNR